MKCEHESCEEEAEINICHNHINKDYPPDVKNICRKEIQRLNEALAKVYNAKGDSHHMWKVWVDETKEYFK